METIKSATLPAGILSNIEIEPLKRCFTAGDLIILMSDGLAECGARQGEGNWIRELVENTDSGNPQEMADLLIENACQYQQKLPDDVTVLVAKLWERV